MENAWQALCDSEKARDAAELALHNALEKAQKANKNLTRRDFELSLIAPLR